MNRMTKILCSLFETITISALQIVSGSNIKILNTECIVTEAGIATILLDIGDNSGLGSLSVTSGKLKGYLNFDIKRF